MPALEGAIEAAFDAIELVHSLMSFHNPASDVSRLNRTRPDETIVVHDWTYKVLAASLDLYRRSNGTFNVAVAPVLQRLGLLPTTSGGHSARAALVSKHAFDVLPGNRVRMREEGTKIDLGGIAKGFAVDRAVDVLRRQGIPNALVNAGGDLAALGPDAHNVDIRDPRNPGRLMFRVAIGNAALASSGRMLDPVEASEGSYSAVIEPNSCQPVTGICGATVRASSCMIADALTKVVMINATRSSELLEHYGACALYVMADGEVEATINWGDMLSIAA